MLPPDLSIAYAFFASPASQGPLWENMTSFTKPEILYVTYRNAVRKDRVTAISKVYRKFFTKFGRMASEIC